MTGAVRPGPGELVVTAPSCPLCGRETECDGDSFRCHMCEASWGLRSDDPGEWDEGTSQCPKVLQHDRHPILSGRCVLSAEHIDGEHNNGKTTWRSSARLLDATESEER